MDSAIAGALTHKRNMSDGSRYASDKSNGSASRMVGDMDGPWGGEVYDGSKHEAQASVTVLMASPPTDFLPPHTPNHLLQAIPDGKQRVSEYDIVFALTSWVDGQYVGVSVNEANIPIGMTETNSIIMKGDTYWDCVRKMKPVGVAKLDVPSIANEAFGVFAAGGSQIRYGPVMDGLPFQNYVVDYPNTLEKFEEFERSLASAPIDTYKGRGLLRLAPLSIDYSPLSGPSGRKIRRIVMPPLGVAPDEKAKMFEHTPDGLHIDTVSNVILAIYRNMVQGYMSIHKIMTEGRDTMDEFVASANSDAAADNNLPDLTPILGGMSLKELFDKSLTGRDFLDIQRSVTGAGVNTTLARLASIIAIPDDKNRKGVYKITEGDFTGLKSSVSANITTSNAALRYSVFTTGADLHSGYYQAHEMLDSIKFCQSQTALSSYNGGFVIFKK